MAQLVPAVFFGHGNPLNALLENSYTSGWRRIGEALPLPRAILAVSAHWFVPFTAVTIAAMAHDPRLRWLSERAIRSEVPEQRSSLSFSWRSGWKSMRRGAYTLRASSSAAPG